jgi:hypothetical protein
MANVNCVAYEKISSLDQISEVPDECIEYMLGKSIEIPIKNSKPVRNVSTTINDDVSTVVDTTSTTFAFEDTTTIESFTVDQDIDQLLSSVGAREVLPVPQNAPVLDTVGVATVTGAVTLLANQAVDAAKTWIKNKLISTKNSHLGKRQSVKKQATEEKKEEPKECNCQCGGQGSSLQIMSLEEKVSSIQDDLNAIDMSLGDLKEGYDYMKTRFEAPTESMEDELRNHMKTLDGKHTYTRQKLDALIRKLKKQKS